MRKFNKHYMTVAIKPSSKGGSKRFLDHVFRKRARDGVVETSLAPDEHRLISFKTGGRVFEKTKCGDDHKLMAELIDLHFKGGKQSQFSYKSVVLSVGDPIDYDRAIKEVEEAAEQYVATYFADCPAWVIGVHVDKAHVHAHIVACNWNEATQDIYNWNRPEVIRMNALRWYKGPLLPGAYLYDRSPDEKRIKAYPKAKLNVLALVSMLDHTDPKASLDILEKDGIVKKAVTKGGHPAVEFRGQVIDLRAINFELNKKTGYMIGVDGRLYAYGTRERSPVEQEIHFNIVVGHDGMAELNRGAGYALSAVEQLLLQAGTPPTNDRYRRHVATGLYKAVRFGEYDDSDEALSPFLGLLRAILSGAAMELAKSPSNSIFFEAVMAMMRYEKHFKQALGFDTLQSKAKQYQSQYFDTLDL